MLQASNFRDAGPRFLPLGAPYGDPSAPCPSLQLHKSTELPSRPRDAFLQLVHPSLQHSVDAVPQAARFAPKLDYEQLLFP